MKIKKILLPILLFILVFSFNSKALAKTEIGSCEYTKTGGDGAATFKVKIFDNKTIEITENNVYQDISDVYVKYMVETGQCYSVATLKKGGGWTKNTIIFFTSIPSDLSSYDGTYVLTSTKNKPITCYYDVRIDSKNQDYNSKYARLRLQAKENASRFFMSFMDSSKNFTNRVDVSTVDEANWFYGKNGASKQGVVEYDLSNKGKFYTNIESNSKSYTDILNSLRSGVCPTGNNFAFETNYIDGIYIYFRSHDIDELCELPNLQSEISFKGSQSGNNNGVITQEGATVQPPASKNECTYTAIYSRKDSRKEEDKFTFNFKYMVGPSTETGFSIKMGGNYRFSNLSTNHILVNEIENEPHKSQHFKLDDDFKNYLRTLSYSPTLTCLENIYVSYEGETMGEQYVISRNSTTNAAKLSTGETAEPQTSEQHSTEYKVTGKTLPDYVDGETVEGCNILGDRFLKYLRSILFWIQVLAPILALVLSMLDLTKAIASADEEAKKKAIKATKTRIIAAVILLLLPFIIEVILSIADNSEGKDCVKAFMNRQ